jgi:hypothetical protein
MSFLVTFPTGFGFLDIAFLGPFVASAEQDNYRAEVAEVNTVTGSEMQTQFIDTLPQRLTIPKIPGFNPIQSGEYPRPILARQGKYPLGERLSPSVILKDVKVPPLGFHKSLSLLRDKLSIPSCGELGLHRES